MGLLDVNLTEEKAKAAMKSKGRRTSAAISDEDDAASEKRGDDQAKTPDRPGSRELRVHSPGSGSRPRSKQTALSQKVQEKLYNYSSDPEYEQIMHEVHDIEMIPSPPERAKNAIAVTLFCIEAAFESRSKDFL